MSYGSFVSSACNLRRNWLECVGHVKIVKPVLSGHPAVTLEKWLTDGLIQVDRLIAELHARGVGGAP